jgi:outer membrane protein TolC
MLKQNLNFFLLLTVFSVGLGVAVHATTPEQIVEYVEKNHPTFLSIQKQLDGLAIKYREARSYYDTQFNLNGGLTLAKQQASSPFDATEFSSVSSKFSIHNTHENGLRSELFSELTQNHYAYPPALAAFGVPSDVGSTKLGVNLFYPLFQNSGGVLDKFRMWSVQQQINQMELNLLQRKREERYRIYNSYYQIQLISEVLKARQNTLERNQEYLVIANRKRQSGFIEGTDLVQTQLASLTSEKDLLDSQQQLKESVRDFKTSLYFPDDYPLEITVTGHQAFDPGSYNNFESRVLSNDLNAQGLSLNVLITLKTSEALQNTLQSNTNLQGSLSFTGKNGDFVRSVGDLLSLQYPTLFVGFQSDLAEASEKEKAQAEQTDNALAVAKYDYQTYLNILKGRVRKAYEQHQHYQKMREIYAKIIEKNKQYIAGLKTQYFQGRADRFQITQAENLYQLAEISAIQNQINIQLAETTLKYLSGSL